MVKLIIAVKRKPDMTIEAFRRHLSVTHADLVRNCPATAKFVRKYVQSYALWNGDALEEPAFDGAAELWFDSIDDKDRFFADPDYLDGVRPDEIRFADMSRTVFFLTEENQVC
ncbi:EthD domain-containing protein [Paraburkholderia sp. BL10I2N1]|uniref:EthD domain-containing protein n=1 Tax=Paraburkholderia sp. BL10I2N1 TaxID=1938796 RepID=UPI00105FA1A9|nr:EthD domain-containing protein [Paraburkholderia sp. BL10I2N1]TDN69990.1 uncharacterized protein (TIGR02118 family) [Paraburkholderia sp. BL10I2N1]